MIDLYPTRKVQFWCDGRSHFVDCIDAPTLTADGLRLKAAAGVHGQYQLFLECGAAPDGDQAIGDGQAVVLNADGSSTFYAVPPTVAA